MSVIIQNAVKVTAADGTGIRYITSAHRHDFQSHKTSDGYEFFIDGGNDYLRHSVIEEDKTKDQIEDFCLSSNSSALDVVRKMLWGTFGRKQEFENAVYVPLCECDSTHLKAILAQLVGRSSIAELVINVIMAQRDAMNQIIAKVDDAQKKKALSGVERAVSNLQKTLDKMTEDYAARTNW